MHHRRLQLGEADLYRTIRLDALRLSPDAFCSRYEDALVRTEASWAAQADEASEGRDRAIFVSLDGDQPVAMAALYRIAPNRGELLQVWVAPEHRGTGIIDDLMDAVLGWARDVGMTTVDAEVRAGNARAWRYYQRRGFVEAGTNDAGDPRLGLALKP